MLKKPQQYSGRLNRIRKSWAWFSESAEKRSLKRWCQKSKVSAEKTIHGLRLSASLSVSGGFRPSFLIPNLSNDGHKNYTHNRAISKSFGWKKMQVWWSATDLFLKLRIRRGKYPKEGISGRSMPRWSYDRPRGMQRMWRTLWATRKSDVPSCGVAGTFIFSIKHIWTKKTEQHSQNLQRIFAALKSCGRVFPSIWNGSRKPTEG